MAKKTAVVEIKADTGNVKKEFAELENSTKSLKAQVKEATVEAQKLLQQFGDKSPEALAAQKNLAKLKEDLADFNQRIEALNPEAKFRALGTAIQGVAGGFTAAQGAAALLGSESEDLQKTLVKLQGALAISQGLNDIRGLGDAFGNLKIVAKDALDSIKNAFLSNPIFTIGLTIATALVATFATLALRESEAEKNLREYNETQDRVLKKAQEILTVKEKGYEREIALAKAAGEETFALEQKKLETTIRRVELEIQALRRKAEAETNFAKERQKEVDQASSLFKQARELELKETVDSTKEKNKRIKELDDELFGLTTQLLANQKSEEKKNNDEKLKNYQDYLSKKEKADQDYLERLRRLEADRLDEAKREAEYQKEIDAKAKQNEEKLAQEQEFQLRVIGLTLEAQEELDRAIKAQQDKANQQRKDNISAIQGFALETTSQNLDTAEGFMEASMNRQLNAAKGNEAKQEQIRKEFFEKQKKVQIAQGLISTFEGGIQAFKSTAASPITVLFPAAPYIAAASAVAFGLSNVAKIRSMEYQGSGGGGGSQGSAPSFGGGLPEFANQPNVPQTQGLNQQQADTSGQNLVRVYVSQGDIQQANNNNSSTIEKATIQ